MREFVGTEEAEKTREGYYIYGIIKADNDRSFGPIGIGERGDEVYTLSHHGLATVISDSPVKKYSITRKNTLAHQKVLEEVMKEYTVLPTRFCTIAENKDGVDVREKIKDKVLSERRGEFERLLIEMADKAEWGVKVLWVDMDTVYREILEENSSIKSLRDKLKREKVDSSQKVELGEMVKKALDIKRERLAKKILGVLEPLSVDSRKNKIFGDSMILNAAFLVQNHRLREFDVSLDALDEELGENIKFKYIGPLPPSDFVEVVINLED